MVQVFSWLSQRHQTSAAWPKISAAFGWTFEAKKSRAIKASPFSRKLLAGDLRKSRTSLVSSVSSGSPSLKKDNYMMTEEDLQNLQIIEFTNNHFKRKI